MRNFLLACLIAVLSPAAHAAERVALVIGVADYATIAPLRNTVNDAAALARMLRQIGFEVTTMLDPAGADLRATLDDFAFEAETADLALVYFAGHGVEVQGENFLIPADAAVRSNRDIQAQAVSLDDLLRAVDRARKMRIVILDSCRDNPFGDLIDLSAPIGGGQAGLAPPAPERGTLVAFAARDGQVALDGEDENSPFALALIDRMAQPGLEISLMFRQVRDLVLERTANRQEPHTYGSLSGEPFYLAGPGEADERVRDEDRRIAWASLRPDQELQLAALAEEGDTRSILGLAYMRLNPDADRFDPAAAARLLSRAAEAGSPEAQFELAKLYEAGLGVAQDEARALALYRQAADQEFADALNDLAFMHYQGGLGLPRDPGRALAYFERAAAQRHPQAMFNYAALIDDGLVAGKGPQEAAGYLFGALRSGSEDVLDILSERPTMFKPETRRALQALLSEHEFYGGAIDGEFGPGTQRGLRAAYGLAE
ncbi:caspase family protein [Rhodovulum euryhalinum]|uniref:Sel1 repeat-containing protein n=1 Tax=Rhodovulum euryhalinum TaxID=35805 RepID=A0A4R2KEA6_9RHOB|nr:caspase family protein [Rhodovulum euryhalinum]TCO70517.1 Sel1 repeat-containing protein [Rhodovulum euryhalinum]